MEQKFNLHHSLPVYTLSPETMKSIMVLRYNINKLTYLITITNQHHTILVIVSLLLSEIICAQTYWDFHHIITMLSSYLVKLDTCELTDIQTMYALSSEIIKSSIVVLCYSINKLTYLITIRNPHYVSGQVTAKTGSQIQWVMGAGWELWWQLHSALFWFLIRLKYHNTTTLESTQESLNPHKSAHGVYRFSRNPQNNHRL